MLVNFRSCKSGSFDGRPPIPLSFLFLSLLNSLSAHPTFLSFIPSPFRLFQFTAIRLCPPPSPFFRRLQFGIGFKYIVGPNSGPCVHFGRLRYAFRAHLIRCRLGDRRKKCALAANLFNFRVSLRSCGHLTKRAPTIRQCQLLDV